MQHIHQPTYNNLGITFQSYSTIYSNQQLTTLPSRVANKKNKPFINTFYFYILFYLNIIQPQLIHNYNGIVKWEFNMMSRSMKLIFFVCQIYWMIAKIMQNKIIIILICFLSVIIIDELYQLSYFHKSRLKTMKKLPPIINNKVSFTTQQALDQTINELDDKKIKQLMELEGQCKIQKLTLLKVNILKAIFLTLLCTVTFIGLLFLVWYKWFRVKVWFSQCAPSEATHVYVQGGTGNDDIEPVHHEDAGFSFFFKKLQYRLRGNSYTPVGFDYQEYFNIFTTEKQLQKGLDQATVESYRKQFGKNQHPVQIPNYFAYMFQVLLKPFFLLQYLVCIAFFVQGYLTFAILNIIFSIITTTINYILTYLSYKKIKDMAQKIVPVKVLRNSQFIQVQSNMVVPGDLIDPEGQIICDCILVRGQIYVNEASLTGQSMPIAKFPAKKLQQTRDDNRWLFEGSKVLQKRDQVLALVVNTGYTTRRGRIIRKILTRVPIASQIFKSALYFLIEAFVVAMIIYFATIAYMKRANISDLIVGFRWVDFLGWSFPPTFPIYFNVAYSFAIVRLKSNGILCIQPQKTVEASNLKVMCFDKTGTLTQNTVQVHQVFKFKDGKNIIDITDERDEREHDLVWKLFATCHTTKKIQGKLMGDQVDLRMFLFSQFNMKQSKKSQVKFQAANESKKITLQVLRINQFESKFQSMSVLVRDLTDGKIYAFIKGAPQKIQKNSILKVDDYEKTVASLSLGGYRTIGFGYRVVPQQEVKKYMEESRQIFEQGITALGLSAFQNKLKHDTRQTIDRLVLAGIEPKIITGDNIFIAVQTGVRAGVISANDQVILLEGRKQPVQQFQPGLQRTFTGILLTRHAHATIQQPITLKQDSTYLNQPYPIAIDNDFLKLNPSPALVPNMKLFARISPQNKALVVMKFKQMVNQQFASRSFLSRLCGNLKPKVGMCGDGANDLMAIRQSDVGMGINDSDASYGATFAIVDMLHVDQIVRDSKATTTNIVQMIRYYQFISFLKIPASLLLILDTAYFNQNHLLFFNFTSTVIYPIFQAMSRPSKTVTKEIPNGNLFGPVNHLRFWGSTIIATGGLIAGYFYFRSTDQFIPNPNPIVKQTWEPLTSSATCMFLLILCPFAIYSLFFYIGSPWKQKIYRNYILFILIILNFISTISLHYITKNAAKVLSLTFISFQVVSILLLISIAACSLGYLFNYIITEAIAGCGSEQTGQEGKKIVGHHGEDQDRSRADEDIRK